MDYFHSFRKKYVCFCDTYVCRCIYVNGRNWKINEKEAVNHGRKKKRPQDRWDEKAGMISKTYKVNKKVAEEFQAACKEKGIAMGVQLTNMMKEFVENNK